VAPCRRAACAGAESSLVRGEWIARRAGSYLIAGNEEGVCVSRLVAKVVTDGLEGLALLLGGRA
jgi:hypothetical protein